MATNTAGSKARDLVVQAVHSMRKSITFDGSLTGSMPAELPDGAIIVGASVHVFTAFDAGTANTINIGVSGEADRFMSAGSLAAAADVPFDDLVLANRKMSGNTDITYAMTLSGTAATAGQADIVIQYIPNNDG